MVEEESGKLVLGVGTPVEEVMDICKASCKEVVVESGRLGVGTPCELVVVEESDTLA